MKIINVYSFSRLTVLFLFIHNVMNGNGSFGPKLFSIHFGICCCVNGKNASLLPASSQVPRLSFDTMTVFISTFRKEIIHLLPNMEKIIVDDRLSTDCEKLAPDRLRYVKTSRANLNL